MKTLTINTENISRLQHLTKHEILIFLYITTLSTSNIVTLNDTIIERIALSRGRTIILIKRAISRCITIGLLIKSSTSNDVYSINPEVIDSH